MKSGSMKGFYDRIRVSEKVLESYKNGITAGQKGAKVIRQGREPPPPHLRQSCIVAGLH
jgi:hypothetical protein